MSPQSPKRQSRKSSQGSDSGQHRSGAENPFDDAAPPKPKGSGPRAGQSAAPSDGYQPAFLYVERGPGMGQLFPIRQGVAVLGRASTAGLRIQHPSISRKQAEVRRRAERIFIRDLGSQNGTYVNGVRIDKETELFAGDELVVGTAQLRLRAQGALAGGPTGKRVARRAAPSTGRVVVAAGIVGSVLAGVAMLIFFQLSRPPPEAPRPEPTVVAAPPPEPPAPAPPPPVQPPPTAKPPPPVRTVAKARTAMDMSDPPRQSPTDSPPRDPAVSALYENGQVGDALALALKKGLRDVASRLARFQALYDAGHKGIATRDEAVAMKNLTAALKLDQELSGGWGKYNAELRRLLSGMYTLSATRHAAAGNQAAAYKALTTALHYDPDNASAKQAIAKLPATAAPAPAPKSPAPKRADIDAAFGK